MWNKGGGELRLDFRHQADRVASTATAMARIWELVAFHGFCSAEDRIAKGNRRQAFAAFLRGHKTAYQNRQHSVILSRHPPVRCGGVMVALKTCSTTEIGPFSKNVV